MALQSLGRPINWPGNCEFMNSTSLAVTAMNAMTTSANHYSAVICQAAEDMVIDRVSITPQASASGVLTGSIETLTSGNPSNTPWNNGANKSLSPNSSAMTAGTNYELVFPAGGAATIPRGSDFAVVYRLISGTLTTGWFAATSGLITRRPYRVTNVSGSAVKADVAIAQFGVGSATNTYYSVEGLMPVVSVGGGLYNSGTNAGIARALRFQVPFACQCVGLQHFNTGSGDHTIMITNDAGTELGSTSTAITGVNNSSGSTSVQRSYFDTAVTLSPATWYRAVVTPTTVTNIRMDTFVLPSLGYMGGMPGGANCHYATYATAGSWVDSATGEVPLLDIMIKQLSDDVQVGGGNVARVIGG